MKTISFDLPAMYGDHHVIEVRRLLFEIPGVEDVYASSGFRAVEVSIDDSKVTEEQLKTTLDEAGYLGDLMLPAEAGVAVTEMERDETYFRHTAAFEQTKNVVGFTQQVPYTGRPLWPCPGMGPIKQSKDS